MEKVTVTYLDEGKDKQVTYEDVFTIYDNSDIFIVIMNDKTTATFECSTAYYIVNDYAFKVKLRADLIEKYRESAIGMIDYSIDGKFHITNEVEACERMKNMYYGERQAIGQILTSLLGVTNRYMQSVLNEINK